MKILVTGGAGFIGTNFLYYIIQKHHDWEVTNLDKLTYAGNLESLNSLEKEPRYHFVKGDIVDRHLVDNLLAKKFEVVVNFAAESHVDRSILDASPFIDTNIKGTQTLLEGARKYGVNKYLQVSTDEVYGSRDTGSFTETSLLDPSSPYSACKASADLLCLAYQKTYQMPIVITRCTNNFGPFQFPEKLIPLVISNALEDRSIPVYGDGLNIRDWIYVLDHCQALDAVIEKGRTGEIYNVAGNNEMTNLEIIREILRLVKKPESLITFVKDRPGHDRRYAIDGNKMDRELDWKPNFLFKKAIAETVKWYQEHEGWWRRIKSGEYMSYYEKQYGQNLF
jgi:dTDP-glucose 4,6-dehydratase